MTLTQNVPPVVVFEIINFAIETILREISYVIYLQALMCYRPISSQNPRYPCPSYSRSAGQGKRELWGGDWLKTRKSCTIGMHNAKLRNDLNYSWFPCAKSASSNTSLHISIDNSNALLMMSFAESVRDNNKKNLKKNKLGIIMDRNLNELRRSLRFLTADSDALNTIASLRT